MSLEDKIINARKCGGGVWAERIYAEIEYAAAVSAVNDCKYDSIIEKAIATLMTGAKAEGGVVTMAVAKAAEQVLMPVADEAKSYKVHCISHAHIDMNWMWGFQETAAVTVDTFRTVLDLMKEYPDLTFGQSQASTYQIIEEYAPEMLGEIRQRIKEGRWEVTASTWVETDKNMPNGESLARHILYTKRYLSKLLDIPAESLNLDFEPDTFGHNISVPEICAKGGVKYYYHCRGNSSDEFAYRWRARSGAEVLVWREPEWYNYAINPGMFRKVPHLCDRYGIKTFMSLFGVGDHGGGPTRRDIDRLLAIRDWPIMPTLVFSTYSAFFTELDELREKFPVVEGELNYIFTGCYTTQTRIKMANRIAEDRMYESEMISAAANTLAGGPRYNESYKKAWEKILFNHFHDILPGSGVIDTREYALGQFQNAMAAVQTNANLSMRAIATAIDTSSIPVEDTEESVSEGAAVGFGLDQTNHYHMPRAERGLGKKRILHLFNSTQYDFDGVTDITVWDWNYEAHLAAFTDTDGNVAESRCIAGDRIYWDHQYKTFAVHVKVPAMGYATYILDRKEAEYHVVCTSDRTDDYDDSDIVMENDKIRAVFDHCTMQLISLVDKKTGENMVSSPSATLRYIQENTVHGATSWRVGDAMFIDNLNETKSIIVREINLGPVRKYVRYSLNFGQRSGMNVCVSLSDSSSMLDFDIDVDFHETCAPEAIPQLNFVAPVGYTVANYRYDVPFGTIDRPEILHDVPANSYAVAMRADGGEKPAVMVVTDTKYGFRGAKNSIAVTLIRASRDPDPYPEYGKHNFRIGVGVIDEDTNTASNKEAMHFVHPIAVCPARAGKGYLPMDGQLFKIEGDVRISSVKTAEDVDGLIVRLSDIGGKDGKYKLIFTKDIADAWETDINENVIAKIPVNGTELCADVEAYGIRTVLIKF